jgi:hypothetical protein
MKAHITDAIALGLKENEAVWDDLDTGFGVRRQRRNAVFIVRYRQNRKRQCLTIGCHGELSAEEARCRALTILESVRKRTPETTPWNIRRSKNGLLYFGEVAERYLNEFAKPRKSRNRFRLIAGI